MPKRKKSRPVVYLAAPYVVFQPATHRALQRGINQIADAIRPTLGPLPRTVAISRILDRPAPEILSDGATIARRIVRLADRDENIGAMLLRDVLWRLHDQVGDGTATAAVLFQSVFNESVRYLTSGGNAMRLQAHLREGVRVILDELTGMIVPLEGERELAHIAEAICHDPMLARMMGEIFDIIGPYGRLEVRAGRRRGLEREYVEGMYWEWGLHSREMITDRNRLRTELEDAAILISDLVVDDPMLLFPALELAIKSNVRSLMIVANRLSDSAIAFLLANKNPEKLQVAVVKTPGWDAEEQAWALQDLAILTGGRPFVAAAGDTFNRIRLEDLGHARRAWADPRNFGVVAGKGDPRALRRHIAILRATHDRADGPVLREKLLKRIGKLMGGSATLWVGGVTERDLNARLESAERTAAAVRGAIMEGVVPGGGVCLLDCRPALKRKLEASADPDERAACRILMEAMAEPARAIIHNAGFDPHEALAQIKLAGPGFGFDVTSGQTVDVRKAGIRDAAIVQKTAVFDAIGAAAMALTIDVLVHKPFDPDEHPIYEGPSGKKKQL